MAAIIISKLDLIDDIKGEISKYLTCDGCGTVKMTKLEMKRMVCLECSVFESYKRGFGHLNNKYDRYTGIRSDPTTREGMQRAVKMLENFDGFRVATVQSSNAISKTIYMSYISINYRKDLFAILYGVKEFVETTYKVDYNANFIEAFQLVFEFNNP